MVWMSVTVDFCLETCQQQEKKSNVNKYCHHREVARQPAYTPGSDCVRAAKQLQT